MFTDPITITVNGVAKTLNKVKMDDYSAVYLSTDGVWQLSLTHVLTTKGRVRTTVELKETRQFTNATTGVVTEDSTVFRHLIDRAKTWTSTEIDYNRAALAAFETSANMLKLYGLET